MLKGFNISLTKIAPLLVFLGLYSCSDGNSGISPIPKIEFVSVGTDTNVLGMDSMVNITVSYIDGDGDLGLDEDDTMPPFTKSGGYWQNLPVRILVLNNGTFEELLNPSTNLPFDLPAERIPRITPEGKNKAITGEITVHLPANPLNTSPDTVKYELTLIDRALNSSNVVTTPTVQLKH